jgi:undecaprenyl diphosphate synthase
MNVEKVSPRHIAVIMDGNGRWAHQNGKLRLMGHTAGAEKIEEFLEWTEEAGIDFVTLYAFSTENWKRSQEEVSGLMKLFSTFIHLKRKLFFDRQIRFRVIGRINDLPASLRKEIDALEKETEIFTRQLILAVSYGGRDEIITAAKAYAKDVVSGNFEGELDEKKFASYLFAPDVPDPDLIIRTSGEFRVSNFLLWQCAYSEFYVTDVLWPDFSKVDFDAAMESYARRERRLGGRLTK